MPDARTSPGCSLFEGDLCLDPEDEAFIKQGILKRNVMTDKNKLWSDAIIYYSVDSDLSKYSRLLLVLWLSFL